ncbi:hypothetical protein EV385_1888 [Krasilnikovia cinnamomea]|uniref:Uncharacterized protein n=1 Tax=Krasilnikovia cinnamomea TaxID=349313 RepID=A0A4Q7ZIN1_9ACTN|nr:hypothetical protein [Krasilnikovia cinnamomea]RZU50123.1 hypothetical protein EV385_1888 [Krasilnikovia cinnamomea]
MDLSTSDLLIGLGLIAVATCAASAVYARVRASRRAPWRPMASAHPDRATPIARLYGTAQPGSPQGHARHTTESPDQSGRHFVRDELLYAKTYRIGPDRRVRAQTPR